MLPAYSYTEYTSPSGNTQIYIVRQKKNSLRKISERRKYLVKQKLLGLSLIILGIIACMMFPEDCGGGLFAIGIGLIRTISNR